MSGEKLTDQQPQPTAQVFNPTLSRRSLGKGLIFFGAAALVGCGSVQSRGEGTPTADTFPSEVASTGIQDVVIQSAYISPLSQESTAQIGKAGLLFIEDVQLDNVTGFGATIQHILPSFGLKPIRNLDYEVAFRLYRATVRNKDGSLAPNVYIEDLASIFGLPQGNQNINQRGTAVTGLERHMGILDQDTKNTQDTQNKITLNRAYVGIYLSGSDIFIGGDNGGPISPTGFFVTRHATAEDLKRAATL